MKETFINASRIVNAEIGLVILAGLLSIKNFSGWFTLVGLIISLLIGIVIYGRILARVEGRDCARSIVTIKENIVNCLVVAVILALPVLLFTKLSRYVSSPTVFVLSREGIHALMNIGTMYALPIVFMKKQNILAIFAGVIYLFRNLSKSYPIILLMVLISGINASGALWIINNYQAEAESMLHAPIMIVGNLAAAYLAFMAFAAATHVLLKSRSGSLEKMA